MGIRTSWNLDALQLNDETVAPSGDPAAGKWWVYFLNDVLTLEDEAGATYDVVTRTATQTLTNKTFTSPVINTGDINTPDIDGGTADSLVIGGATPAAATVTTLGTTGAVTMNDAGADVDVRIEGDTDQNLVFVDASTDRVGIGTATPSTKLDVSGTANATAMTSAAGTFTTLIATLLKLATSTELTLATDAITATQSFHRVDTEADAASDNLATINGGAAGYRLILRAENTARTVVIKHDTGNIQLFGAADVSLDETYKFVELIYDSDLSKWVQIGGSGGGSGSYYQTIRVGGSGQTQRGKVNYLAGTNITITPGDDAGNDETELTIAAGATPGGGAPPSINEGRLTLTTAVPVTTADVTGASAATVYWALHTGNNIGLYDGASAWTLHALSEKSISLAGLLPYSIHDVFMDYNAGTPVLALLAWTAGATGSITGATNATPIVITSNAHGLANDDIVSISGVGGNTAANGEFRVAGQTANTFNLTTLADASVAGNGVYTSGGTWYKGNYTGTRATTLTRQDGIYVLTGATDWRYLGTVRMAATAGQSEDSAAKRLLWNYYHRHERPLLKTEATSSWSYSTAAWRAANNSAANRVQVVVGVAEDPVQVTLLIYGVFSATAFASIGIGVDVTNANNATAWHESAAQTGLHAVYRSLPAVGGHFYQWVEYTRGGTPTWYGTNATFSLSGLTGIVRG